MNDVKTLKNANSSEECLECIYCGSENIIKLSKDEFECLDCGEILSYDDFVQD